MSVLTERERQLIEQLQSLSIEFAVIGGAAVVLHGHNRKRKDLDILLYSKPQNIERLAEIDLTWLHFNERQIADLKEPGAQFSSPERGLDILTGLKGVAAEDVIQERVFITSHETRIPVISRNHLIREKLAVGEQIDLADVAALSARL